MTRVYYKDAIAAIIWYYNKLLSFDLNRPITMENALKWREDINSKIVLPNKEPIPMIL
jgi:Ras-related protein Rab-7L1